MNIPFLHIPTLLVLCRDASLLLNVVELLVRQLCTTTADNLRDFGAVRAVRAVETENRI